MYLKIISLVVLITGGVSFAQERYIFEITAKNNVSNVTTQMQVYAQNERDAKENVSLNGWQVISVRQLTFREVSAVPITVGEPMPAPKAKVETPAAPMTNEELIDSILGPSVQQNGAVPPSRNVSGGGFEPLSPDSAKLTYRLTLYFDFGIIQPNITDFDRKELSGLDKNGVYYVYGNTDDVSVNPENKSYTDNFDLSFKRAEAVRGILVDLGINTANINTVGLGSTYPNVRSTPGATGTVLNRRVEIFQYK